MNLALKCVFVGYFWTYHKLRHEEGIEPSTSTQILINH